MHHGATILQLLDRLNRKERYFLVGFALGNPRFQLSEEFRRDLTKSIRRFADRDDLHVPRDAYCWMDYHLDWVWAAIALRRSPYGKKFLPSPNWPPAKPDGDAFNINRNQEDTDPLIGYEDHDGTHLVFIEAKGSTNWSITQIESKGRRLGHLFGQNGDKVPGVTPYMVLASPIEPDKLNEARVPTWMKPKRSFVWMPLRIPPDRLVTERYDKVLGRNENATGWRLSPVAHGNDATVMPPEPK
jgi:hypothetical protein